MKKLLFAVTLVLVSSFVNAQTTQGSWLVGASSDFSFSSSGFDETSTKQSRIGISGQSGYFVADNLAVGLIVGLNRSSLDDFVTVSSSVGPFARYYFNGALYLGAGFTRVGGKSKMDSNVISESSGGNLLFKVGYPIWLVKNIAVEPALNYALGTGDLNGGSTLSLGVDFMLYF